VAKIRYFSRKIKLNRTIGKNIGKAHKIVLFLKKEIEK